MILKITDKPVQSATLTTDCHNKKIVQ